MRRFTFRTLTASLIFVFLASIFQDAGAGPWPQRKGFGFYKLGFGFVQANRFYEPNGNIISIPTLADYTVSFYGEYGFTNRITGIAYIPFLQRITLNKQIGRETGAVFFEGAANTGFADTDIGVRFGLLQKGNTVISGTLTFGIPLGDDAHENGLLTGDGEFNQIVSLGLGHSFYPAPAYVAVEAGYNNRTQGYSDEFRYGVEAGYTFQKPGLTVIGRARGLEPLRNGDDGVMGGMGGLSANNQRYLAYGVELAYTITSAIGISAGVEGATLGENVLSAPAYSTGIFLTL